MTSSIAELNELLTTLANMKAKRDQKVADAKAFSDAAAKALDDSEAAKREAEQLETMIKVLSNAESAMNGIIKQSEELKVTLEAERIQQAADKDETFRKFAREIIDRSCDDDTVSFAKDELTRLGLDEETDQEAQPGDGNEEQAELDLSTQAA
jgi:ABC-type transporter Mla subunit MlaD